MISPKWLFVLFVFLSTGANAQWLNYPTPGTPRTADGKPNLAAPAPRAIDGKPDLSGVWFHQRFSLAEMKRLFGPEAGANGAPGMGIDTLNPYAINILLDVKPEQVSMRPAAQEILRRRAAASGGLSGTCVPLGMPLNTLVSEPDKIIQSPAAIVILYESDGSHRQILTDGRALPKEIAQPSWLGYSVGKWDHDTLVVESTGFNDKTSLDTMGHPHSENLRIVEHYHRRDFGHLDVEVTIDDPEMYTKAFSIKYTQNLVPDTDLLEYICGENEKDKIHEGQK